jgi:hypothetical protein
VPLAGADPLWRPKGRVRRADRAHLLPEESARHAIAPPVALLLLLLWCALLPCVVVDVCGGGHFVSGFGVQFCYMAFGQGASAQCKLGVGRRQR